MVGFLELLVLDHIFSSRSDEDSEPKKKKKLSRPRIKKIKESRFLTEDKTGKKIEFPYLIDAVRLAFKTSAKTGKEVKVYEMKKGKWVVNRRIKLKKRLTKLKKEIQKFSK